MNKRIGTIALVVLFAFQAFWGYNRVFPKWQKFYAPPRNNLAQGTGLSPDQLLFALSGFREMVAGILWVRCDSFFDQGNYDAMLPLIRLVTLLDPHQIDVFTTGMWHIAYNFTDEEERSDRRYIPSALALGREGMKANPNTYELFFEEGWLWYNKIDDDYGKAVTLFTDANERTDIQPARRNLLAWSLIRNGQLDEALNRFYKLYDDAEVRFRKETADYTAGTGVAVIEDNLDNTLVRMSQRGTFAMKQGRSLQGYDVNPPFDVGFSVKVTVPEPAVLRVQANWNVLPAGTRIRIVLRDADYPTAKYATMDWDAQSGVKLDPDKDLTWMQDQIYIKNRAANKRIDMSRDHTMYPFAKEHYVIEFYYNPRSTAAFMQDRFGWSGEGMTDQRFLRTDVRPGQRCVYTSFDATREQLLRLGEWSVDGGKIPTFVTPNFKEPNVNLGSTEDVINVPSLRESAPAKP